MCKFCIQTIDVNRLGSINSITFQNLIKQDIGFNQLVYNNNYLSQIVGTRCIGDIVTIRSLETILYQITIIHIIMVTILYHKSYYIYIVW